MFMKYFSEKYVRLKQNQQKQQQQQEKRKNNAQTKVIS